MPFDSQNPFDPTDPAQWARIRALPHIVVRPNPVPDASPPDDGIDDWFAPWQAPDDGPDDWIVPGRPAADGYPDDWIVPPPAVPGTGQPPTAAPPTATNSANSFPAAPPDPWHEDPPRYPLPLSPSPSGNNFSAPISPFPPPPAPPAPPPSWPPTLGLDNPPWRSPQSLPNPTIPKGGMLDALATLGTGWPAGEGGLLGGLRNLGTQPASTPSLPKGGILDVLATLGTSPNAAPTWPQGRQSGFASPNPGSGGFFSSPQPFQSANASAAAAIARAPIGSYSPGEVAIDGAKSFGVGLGRGVIQLAGLPGDAREMLAHGAQGAVDYFAPGWAPNAGETLSKTLASTFHSLSGPTSSQLQTAAESLTGPFYQPKTIFGDYAQTAGEFLPGALLMPEGALATKALRYGLLPALSSETAGQLTKGTPAEPWARVVGAILSAPASPWRDLPLARKVPETAETLPSQVVDRFEQLRQNVEAGRAGEDAVGIPANAPKPRIWIPGSGRTRYPDRLTQETIEEVKNARYLALTQQIRDYLVHAEDNGLTFILHVRPGVEYSRPLKKLIDARRIIDRPIEGLEK